MLFRKHERPTSTPADEERRRLHHKVLVAQSHLSDRVENVIIHIGTLNLYPRPGEDWDRAMCELEEARESLICAVKTLDIARAELIQFIEDHMGEFVDTASWPIPDKSNDAHRYVETVCRNYYSYG